MTLKTSTTILSTLAALSLASVTFADEPGYRPWPPVQCDWCAHYDWLPATIDQDTSRAWVALDAYGEANPGAEPSITFVASESSATRSFFHVQLHGFWAGFSEHHQAEDNPAAWEFSIPGQSSTNELGLPALPAISFRALVGQEQQVTLETVQFANVAAWSLASYDGETYSEVFPAQPDVEEVSGSFALPEYALNREWYQETNVAWPQSDGSIASIDQTPRADALVSLNPFRYNPSEGSIYVARTMGCFVRHIGGGFEPFTLNAATAQRLDDDYVNFDALVAAGIAQPIAAPVRNYLIIHPEAWRGDLEPLVALKRSRGFNVDFELVESIGSDTAAMQQAMQDWYTGLDEPGEAYVLLVGDSALIPHKVTSMANSNGNFKTSDTLYTCLNNAYEPMFSIGRFPAESSIECAAMVAKSVRYQNGPGLDADFYSTATIAAHDGEQAYLSCAEEIIDSVSYGTGRLFIDRSGDTPDGLTDAVLSDIEFDNVGLALYRGHGAKKRWSSWDFDNDSLRATDVAAIGNTSYNPVVVSVACSNSNMASEPECIAVRWMETETGAAAHIGAMAGSKRFANNAFAIDLMDRFQSDVPAPVATAMQDALCETMIQKNGNSSSRWNFEVYQCLGDPSMRVWNEAPAALQMTTPDEIEVDRAFTVQVRRADGSLVHGAVVVASDHTNVHATAYTDSNGTATLTVRDCLKPVITLRAWTPLANTLDAIHEVVIDGGVDGADLGLLLAAFGTSDPASDRNGDGIVDGADLGLLLAAW